MQYQIAPYRFILLHLFVLLRFPLSIQPPLRSGDGSSSYDGDSDGDSYSSALESTSGASDDEDETHEEPHQIDLSLWRLQSLHAAGKGDPNKISKYAQSGMSTSRIRASLNSPACTCQCRVPAKLLADVCKSFWHLRKEVQDALLWSLQMESGRGSKRRWAIGGCLLHQMTFVP